MDTPEKPALPAKPPPRLTTAQRIGLGIVRVQIMLGITLALFLVVEMWAGRQLRRENTFDRPAEEFWMESDTYRDTPWLGDLVADMRRLRVAWSPYVYWKAVPMSGRCMNVDSNGLRLTVSPDLPAPTGRVVTVCVFGGSTVWGFGVRDEGTVASHLQRTLRARGLNVRVANHGDGGFVSTQDMIRLELLMREGRAPDLAVFLTGFNDIYSTWENGEAGIPQNEVNRRREFQLSMQTRKVAGFLLTGGSGGWSVLRLLRKRILNSDHPVAAGPDAAERIARLAGECWTLYDGNRQIIRRVTKGTGTRAVFFWQPVMTGKAHPTPFEDGVLKLFPPGLAEMHRRVDALAAEHLAGDAAGDTHYLGALFADTRAPRFIDHCHLNEAGNAELAEAMAERLLPMLTTH